MGILGSITNFVSNFGKGFEESITNTTELVKEDVNNLTSGESSIFEFVGDFISDGGLFALPSAYIDGIKSAVSGGATLGE